MVAAAERVVDAAMMERALVHAARGQGRTTPNPMVGAVIVAPDNVVVGHGWHARAGEPHAEVHALEAAGERATGATMYVTLEPCCHVGRTGPCTRRIIDAGITRVVVAMRDPDPRVNGRGIEELRAHGVRVDEGIGQTRATRLNEAFISVKTRRRPLVILKTATSLDGRVAARPGVRTELTSSAANRKTHQLRAAVDALAVGSETVLVDDPWLTARECARVRPLVRVVFDRRLRTPRTARLFSTLADGPVIILTSPLEGSAVERARALEDVGASVREAGSLHEALGALTLCDVSALLVEGGPRLQRAFWEAGLVDRIHLVIAPCLFGQDGVPWLDAETLPLSSLSPVTVEQRGADVWIEADVHRHR